MPRRVPVGVLAAITVIAVGLDCGARSAMAATPAVQMSALNWGQQNYVKPADASTIVLSPEMHGSIASLKAANPTVKVLMYDDVTFTSNGDCSTTRNTAVSYCSAIASDPTWFVRSASGQPIAACDFPGYYWMDVGNAGYRAAVAADAVNRAKSLGFDGVVLDDVNTHPGHCENGKLAADTPSYTDQAWGAATVGLMSVVGPAVKAAGMIVEPNVSADPWTAYQENDLFSIASYSSRVFQEFWLRWNCSSCTVFTGSAWLADLEALEGVQSHGAGYAANTYSDGSNINTATILYTRATLLLGWNGSAQDLYQYNVICSCSNNYSPDESISIGTPTDSRYQVGVAWRRDFTDGVALVNPSPSSSQSVILGACYLTPTGSQVEQLTLAPATGTILQRCTAA